MRLIGLAVAFSVSVALAPPAEAQPPAKIPRLGYLVVAPLSDTPSRERAAFLTGLRELGWIEGKTIAIEYRSAKWNLELLDDLAEELVRLKVDIILAAGGGAPLIAAKRATSTIPIVMTGSADPVAQQLVASLGRPGGNVTGMATMLPELGSKRLELLKEAVPRVARVAVLWTPPPILSCGRHGLRPTSSGLPSSSWRYGTRTTWPARSQSSRRNDRMPSRCSSMR